MFFWADHVTNQQDTKASLRVNNDSKKLNPYSSKYDFFPVYYSFFCGKRTFRSAPSYQKASMTVEAALAFSLFLFFLVNIFSLIFLFIQYGERLEKLQQQGKELAMYAYTLQDEAVENKELIRLTTSEKAESPFPVLITPEASLEVRCVIKPWTGYDVVNGTGRDAEEETVFMADHGEVYHRSRNCSHLALSIRVAAFSAIKEEKNLTGSGYSPCEYCGTGNFGTAVYITDQGNRYHSSLGCQSLKRTVRAVYLSEIAGVPACSKCGG